jgi:hypothetical protein
MITSAQRSYIIALVAKLPAGAEGLVADLDALTKAEASTRIKMIKAWLR